MKIAINTRFLIKDKIEGIGRYTYEIVKRLVLRNPQHEFYLIFDRQWDPEFEFAENVIPVKVGPQARHPVLWKIWFEHTLPAKLKKIKPDVFLSMDGYTSLRTKFPKVTVIHDLAFEHFPKYNPGSVTRFYKRNVPKYVEKSDHIIAISEATKEDLINTYKTPAEKISIVYNAAKDDIAELGENVDIEPIVGTQPYFLYVGAIHPRKNVDRLLRAFDNFRKTNFRKYKLVITGRKAWSYREVEEAYEGMKFKKDVIFTDYLDEKSLSALYLNATALVYVSVFEGFGLPLVEAQKCGCPVITSNLSSMPEVVGGGAVLVNPRDVKSITGGMGELVHVPGLMKELKQKGLENVQRFSWDRSAEKLMKILEETINAKTS